MEKLETILHAEEASRRAISNARAHARELIKEARIEAELTAVEADRETAEQIAQIRARVLRESEITVGEIEREAQAEFNRVIQQAESRFAGAVDAVVDALVR